MATARDLLKRSLRLISEEGNGIASSNASLTQALESLNDYLGNLSADGLMIPSITEESFTLTVGQDNYTIGVGGDFNTARPTTIEVARLSITDIDYDLSRMRIREYNRIPAKNVTAIPERFYYEPAPTLGLFKLDYQPDRAYTLYLSMLKPLGDIAGLTTVITLPPEYRQFIVYNMAVLLAPEYDNEASQTVMREAERSMKAIKRLNGRFRVPQSSIDSALVDRQGYNITRD